MAVSACNGKIFQPTPSSRRVTLIVQEVIEPVIISTNTLLAEGDHILAYIIVLLNRFQPTPSSRRVTLYNVHAFILKRISTNTLLAEGDTTASKSLASIAKISTNTLLAEGDTS